MIFLPGFLGTRVTCGSKEQWPSLPFPDLVPMSLNADGATDAGCQPTAVLETALGSNVYKTVANYVRAKYGARGTLFGWDWRKRPQPQFTKLEEAIDTALDRPGPWKQQQAGRVVLWGHSYGGLFIRAFIEGSGGDRVARVLTAGTPYWGSPKSFFPLAFGVESPGWSHARRAGQQQPAEGLREEPLRALQPLSRAPTSRRGSRLAACCRTRRASPRSSARSAATARCSTRRAPTTRTCSTASTTTAGGSTCGRSSAPA